MEVLASLYYHAISLILKWKEASIKSQETSSCGSKRSNILQDWMLNKNMDPLKCELKVVLFTAKCTEILGIGPPLLDIH